MEYQFREYRVSDDQQILFRGTEAIQLGTKIYYLLLVFVENAGQILSKDQIIDSVWPGQIVTDAALVKQILRLRKILDDPAREIPFIETHRSVGYRFTPPVDRLEKSTLSTPPARDSQAGRWLWLTGLVAFAVLIWTLSQTGKQSNPDLNEQSNEPQTVTLAVMPSTGRQDWLNRGGLDYLADLLSENDLIHTINPEPDWYSAESPEELAIDLTTHKKIQYSCLIEIEKTTTGYRLEAKLRSDTEVMATTSLEDETLTGVFDKTDKWINTHLFVHDQVSTQIAEVGLTEDRYALESYLQGVYELEVTNNKKKAMEYFQAAVNKDPDFFSAWIRLGETKIDVADYDKAISISNTLLLRGDVQVQPRLVLKLRYLIARAYASLLDYERAAEYASLTGESLEQVDDPYLRIDVYRSLSLLAQMQRQWDTAAAYMFMSIDLANEHYPLPNTLGDFHSKLAWIYEQQRKFDLMKEQIDIALVLYEETNNVNGIMYCFNRLARYYIITNRFDEGVLLTSRADPYLDQTTRPDTLAYFLETATMLLNLRGLFDKSQTYILRVQALAAQTGNRFYMYTAEFLKLHRLYVQNRFEQSLNQVGAMIKQFKNDPQFSAVEKFVLQLGVLISSRCETPSETEQRIQYLEEHYPAILTDYVKEVKRAKGHLAVNQGQVDEGLELLRQSEKAERENKDTHLANYVAFEILEVLLDHPELEYQSTLNRVEANTHYDYLFFKLKAQFLAREGRFLEAAMLMQENKLKANQLWKPEDQLLLEQFQQKSS